MISTNQGSAWSCLVDGKCTAKQEPPGNRTPTFDRRKLACYFVKIFGKSSRTLWMPLSSSSPFLKAWLALTFFLR